MATKRETDYSWGPGRSPTMGAFNAGFAAFNATACAYMTHTVHPGYGVGFGAVAAAGSMVALAVDRNREHTEGRAMCYRAACWLGAGIWSTVQLSLHPWSWDGGVVLAGLVAAASIVGESIRFGERRQQAEVEAKAAEAERLRAVVAAAAQEVTLTTEQRIAQVWEPRFRKICRVPELSVTEVELWPTEDGYTIGGWVPDDGTTVEGSLKPREKQLATAAGLGPGCNVEILANVPDMPRRYFQARVNTVNAFAEAQPYPDDGYGDRTIVDMVPLGMAADRSVGGISVLDDGAMIVGQKGSGKSTTLNIATAGIARCPDGLVFAIDKKGYGEYPRRWVAPWVEGRAERPAIHLVAVTDEQAELMTLGLINIVRGRPVAYARQMGQAGERKINPTPFLPQIVLVVDEWKDLSPQVQANVGVINDLGRSAGVEVIVCALDAKSVPYSLHKQLRERVGMRFNDEAELQRLFDATWRSGRFDPASMTHAGMMLISNGARPPSQHKGYDLTPAQIDAIAVAVGVQRPPLDAASVKMFDTVIRRRRDDKGVWQEETLTGVYARWWGDVLPLMFGEHADEVPAPAPPPRAVSSSGDVLDALAKSGVDLAAKVEAARSAAAAAEAARESAPDGGDPDQRPAQAPDPDFDAVVAAFDLRLPARQEYYRILRIVGDAGIGGTEMSARLREAGYSTHRATVQDWFVEDFGHGRLEKLEGGKYRWASPDGAES